MTLTFYSNYLCHLKIALCDELYKILGNGFTFVETEPMHQERKDMGWPQAESCPYHLIAWKDEESYEKSLRLAAESDIIIHSYGTIYKKIRRKTKKPIICFSERYFKKGFGEILNPHILPYVILGVLSRLTVHRNYPAYMLCAGAYLPWDLKRIFAYRNKQFRFGYITAFKEYDIEALLDAKAKTQPVKIVWAGRLIDWKHPEAAIEVARYLSSKAIAYTLDFVGDGECRQALKEKAEIMGGGIRFLGAMGPHEVRAHMEKADIYLFTSDFGEGWGAVLNEAMNSGCAVVASHAAGATRYLIKHGVNGYIYAYERGKTDALCEYAEKLARDSGLRRSFGAEAYRTIKEEWGPHIVADRLVSLSDAVLKKQKNLNLFKDGPCSKAPVMKNNDTTF